MNVDGKRSVERNGDDCSDLHSTAGLLAEIQGAAMPVC